jgi:hypothetical protein
MTEDVSFNLDRWLRQIMLTEAGQSFAMLCGRLSAVTERHDSRPRASAPRKIDPVFMGCRQRLFVVLATLFHAKWLPNTRAVSVTRHNSAYVS